MHCIAETAACQPSRKPIHANVNPLPYSHDYAFMHAGERVPYTAMYLFDGYLAKLHFLHRASIEIMFVHSW